jgi:hypothetical protein
MGLFLSGFWGLQAASYRLMAKSNLVKSLPIRRNEAIDSLISLGTWDKTPDPEIVRKAKLNLKI